MNQESGMKKQRDGTWKLTFHVEESATDVILLCGLEEIAKMRIEPNRELLEKLLPAVDTLLAAQKITPRDIADVHVESDLPDGYSSRRIAETVAGVWKRFSW